MDPGELLKRFREDGCSEDDARTINQRLLTTTGTITENNIPDDVTYATHSNMTRAAINEGLFCKALERIGHKDKRTRPPLQAICIKGSNIRFGRRVRKEDKTKFEYATEEKQIMLNIVHAFCGEGHCKDGENKNVSPMLKLYYGCDVMLTDNQDVENNLANGTVGKFVGIKLVENISVDDLDIIEINGYLVHCVEAKDVHRLLLQLQEPMEKIIEIKCEERTVTVQFPDVTIEKNNGDYMRLKRKMKLLQFPVNLAMARTTHKLQGKSLDGVVVAEWSYESNWAYVVLSRVRSIDGLFLRRKLEQSNIMPMSAELREFLRLCRQKIPIEEE